jgi:hypothetical protein
MMTGTLGFLMLLMMSAMLAGFAAAGITRLRRRLKQPR